MLRIVLVLGIDKFNWGGCIKNVEGNKNWVSISILVGNEKHGEGDGEVGSDKDSDLKHDSVEDSCVFFVFDRTNFEGFDERGV